MSDSEWHVATDDRDKLAHAVLATLQEDGARVAWLRAGAASSVAAAPGDAVAAKRFQNVLELAYLVASADGFDAAERVALAHLLEQVTGAAVDHDTLEQHFRDLDDAVALLGRRERLARAAAELDGGAAREEAIAMVALIALGDGRISRPEFGALLELGHHVELSPTRVRELIDATCARVEARLR